MYNLPYYVTYKTYLPIIKLFYIDLLLINFIINVTTHTISTILSKLENIR